MKLYNGKEVTFNFASIDVDAGLGDDVFVRIEKINGGRFTAKAGVDGEVTRSLNGDNIHRVTLTLQQTSKFNDALSAVHLLDVQEDGAGVAPLMVRDRKGTDLFTEPEAFIEMLPDQEKAREAGEVEWRFLCPDPKRFVGGN